MDHPPVLSFENQPLQLLEHDGRLWLKSADIARALGYARADRMSRVYDRHKSEFTPSMTCIVETPTLGHGSLVTETRLFSLRGAHLLGMFARTEKGVAFRRWVLDQLEQIEAHDKDAKSLIAEFYAAAAKLDNQERFASMCGKGLSDHRRRKPPLAAALNNLVDLLQPKLSLF